jgi:hypothetical protein
MLLGTKKISNDLAKVASENIEALVDRVMGA